LYSNNCQPVPQGSASIPDATKNPVTNLADSWIIRIREEGGHIHYGEAGRAKVTNAQMKDALFNKLAANLKLYGSKGSYLKPLEANDSI
jgi:hypothetical protein